MIILIVSIILISASVYLFIKFDNSTDILREIKNTLYLWIIFWLGIGIELGMDFFLRWKNGGSSDVRISESYWLFFQLILAVVVSILVYKKLPNNKNSIFKMFLISIQVLSNFIIYLFVLVFYILESGLGTM